MVCRNVYIIPTNRLVGNCAQSYLPEISLAIEVGLVAASDLAFVVVEDGSQEVCSQNAKALTALAKVYPQIAMWHLTLDAISRFLVAVCGEDKFLTKLFEKQGTNYGRVANLTSLVAAAFGAEYVHRRDSDTSLFQDGRKLSSPLLAELTCFCDESKGTALVGSNYFERIDINLEAFVGKKEPTRELFRALGIPSSALEEKLQANLSPCVKELQVHQIDTGAWPDMGNVAYGNLYRQVCFPPHLSTLGADYFLMRFCQHVGLSMYWHNQRVVHRYVENRIEDEHLVEYYVKLARYVDYDMIYAAFPCLSEKVNDFNSFLARAVNHVVEKVPSMSKQRGDAQGRLVRVFESLSTDVGRRIAHEVRVRKSEILETSERSTREHARLAGAWESMMSRAALVGSHMFSLSGS